MKSILPVLVSIVLVMTFCSCGGSPQQQQPGGISKGAAVSNAKNSSLSSFVPTESEIHHVPREKMAQAQFVSQNQAFSLKNSAPQYTYECTFQLKSTLVSKKLTGFQKADIDPDSFNWYKATVDASGNFTSAHSYVYLDFTIKNALAKEAKICLGNFEIVPVFADNTTTDGGFELQAFDKPQHGKNSKDIWFYKFQANEETTFRMLYIVPDKELKNNLYLEVNPTGANGNLTPEKDYEAKRFVKLNLS